MPQAPDPDHDALKPGTRLGEFEIECVLGMGGFGIVYRALDHALERRVALKEYMPAALTLRGPDGQVQLRSPSQADTFELGRRSFINEARLLARFDHPSLVKVYRFWEENDTAYMVMPYYEGITLREARRDMPRPPSDAWLRGLLEPLLGALDVLHQAQVYHRDIAPDNILLLGDTLGEGEPRPVLLDFGAARHVIGDHTQTLTAIVKPSFAPIEQYAESAQLKQGPWTDIYALAAAVHYCITGRAPMPATTRVVHDELPPLSSIAAVIERDFGRHYTPTLMAAIDHALAVRPNERPASVAAWRAEINFQGDAAQASPSVVPSLVASTPTTPQGALASAATADAAQVGRTVVAASAAATDGSRPAVDAYATTAPAAAPARFSDAYARTMPDPFLAGHRAARQKVSNDQVAEAQSRLQEARNAVDQEPTSATWGNLVRHPVLLGVAVMLLFAVIATTIQRNKRQPDGAAAPAAMVASSAASARHASAQQTANNAATSAADSPEKNAQATAERRGERAAERLAERAERRAATAASRPETRRDDAPAELCAGRNFLTRLFCLKRECSKPEYRQHPQCVRLREQEEANRPRQP